MCYIFISLINTVGSGRIDKPRWIDRSAEPVQCSAARHERKGRMSIEKSDDERHQSRIHPASTLGRKGPFNARKNMSDMLGGDSLSEAVRYIKD